MLSWGLTYHFFLFWKMVPASKGAFSPQLTEEIVRCMFPVLLWIPGLAKHKGKTWQQQREPPFLCSTGPLHQARQHLSLSPLRCFLWLRCLSSPISLPHLPFSPDSLSVTIYHPLPTVFFVHSEPCLPHLHLSASQRMLDTIQSGRA